MLDSFERDGEWWLPGDAAVDRVFGRLSFDPAGGVRLKAMRPFRAEQRLASGERFRPELILGFVDYGRPVTLYLATRMGWAHPPLSDEGSDFYARYAFLGHHFQDEGSETFVSLKAGFTDLEEWSKHSPFVGTIPVPGNTRTGYMEMTPVEAEVEDLEARVSIKSSMQSWALVPCRTLRWEHRIVFEVEPEEARPPQWYRQVLGGLQELLTLLVGRPVYPSFVEARVHREGKARADLFFDGGARKPGGGSPSAVLLSRESDVLLPLPQVQREFPGALENWFAKREMLAPVYDLFFGVFFGPGVSPEYQFLSLAQALETYHRRTRPDSRYLDDEEYQGLYEEIVEALPGTLSHSLRSRLTEMLKYGNEWSLRKRLKDLLSEIPEGVIEHSGDDFVSSMVNTRNYLTHYTEELRQRALHGTELNEAVDELRRLVAFLMLRELGFSEEKIVAALHRVTRYEYFSLED